jgi:UDP-glucose 4-epimerase
MSRLVLVTGGAGFIGSHLVDALLARGDRVRVLDDFSTGRRENLAQSVCDIELLEGDVRDPGLVARAVAGCDGVLHEAAVASVTQSLRDPVGAGSVTHGGTVNVARLAGRAGVGAFVLASSCAVYGDAERLPVGEDTPPRPRSPYALAKLLSEGVCHPQPASPSGGLSEPLTRSQGVGGGTGQREAVARGAVEREGDASASSEHERTEMRAVALRYFNVYGPRQDPSSEYSGVIARFMEVGARRANAAAASRDARSDGPGGRPRYVVYGDGRQSRDFVFVSDVVAANLQALDACLAGGAVLNVGTGVQVDLLRIVAEAERLCGGGSSAAAGLAGDFRPAREGDIRHSQADIGLARRVLGYEPAVDFADGLAKTYAWYAAGGTAGAARAGVS